MLFQTVSNAHIIRQSGDQFSQLSYCEIRNLTALMLSALFDKQKLKIRVSSSLAPGCLDVRLKVMRVPLKPDERLNTICHGQCHTY